MLIRHKLILWFILFSALLLSFYSVYIYLASANSRKNSFVQRIKVKALATRDIYELRDKIAEKIITTIPEQSEYVFDENNKLIFAINNVDDFDFDPVFFATVEKRQEYTFDYKNRISSGAKDGYAFVFSKGNLKRTIVITAYNKSGYEDSQSLASILIIGNIFFLLMVGLAAYGFSIYIFRPVNDLVTQAESVGGHDLNFRLTYANPKDEIGIVASSFNKALNRLQGIMESQKSFISYASHELRTPLAAINGILETSVEYDKEKEAMRESMLAARKEIQRATGLVNGLLQLAKIESSERWAEMTRLNIVDVLLDVISFFKQKTPQQEFLFNIHQTIEQDSWIEITGHPQLLRMAFMNLVDNASKYSQFKKIEIHLETLLSQRIRIKIVDQGVGILKEETKQLFAPFFRGQNASGFEGFGLGLSLTKKIFDMHKGVVELHPNEMSGVTAEVILPATITANLEH